MTTVVPVVGDGRVAVLGDIGGHLDALLAELSRLGVAEGGHGPIPPWLTIIQVGDLVHRGPDSPGVVALVDRHLSRSPERWIQLVGNHEAFYLRRRQFSWPDRLPRASAAVLRRWWNSGAMQVAVAITTPTESFLVTHAGVTHAFWRELLGAPKDAALAARTLNLMATMQARDVFRPGTLVGWRRPTPLAGPVWAAAGQELVAGWEGTTLPFSQIHGHTSVYDWDARRWYVESPLRDATVVDEGAKHVTVPLQSGRLIGVDPGQDALAGGQWRSLVFEG